MFCIWLLPVFDHGRDIRAVIEHNMRVLNRPAFEPHLTLFGSDKEINDDIFFIFNNIVNNIQLKMGAPLKLLVKKERATSGTFYKSFYIQFFFNEHLDYIFDQCRAVDQHSRYVLDPHVSLAYGTTNLINLLSPLNHSTMEFDQICLVSDSSEESDEAIKSWKIIQSRKLYRG